MADNELKTRLISAFGYAPGVTGPSNTIPNWSDVTEPPRKGEVCYGLDANHKIVEIRIGQGGTTVYSDLPKQNFTDTDTLYQMGVGSFTTAVSSGTVKVPLQKSTDGGTNWGNDSTCSVVIPAATTVHAGLMSKDDKIKLNGIAPGAEVNQNAFSNVKVGSTTVAADSKTDTLELASSTNIIITPDATNDKITFSTNAEINQNAFSNVKIGVTTVSANSKTGTFELAAEGDGIKITGDHATKTITFENMGVVSLMRDASNSLVVNNDTTVVTFGDAAFKSTTGSISTSTDLPTAGAVKTYVDNLVANATHFCGGFSASGDGAIDGQTGKTLKTEAEKIGDVYTVTTAGTYLGIAFEVGDSIIFKKAVAAGTAPTTADFITVEGETSVSVVDSNPTLKWGTKTQVGTVEGSALNVTGMPAPKSTSTAVIDVINNNNQIEIAHKASGVTSGSYGDGTHILKATIDSYGHITSATTVKVPSATTAAEGLTKKPSGTAPISVNANNVISHDNSGVSAGTYGATTQQTPSHGGTFSVPYVTVDDKGHVTSASTASVKLPNDNNTYPTTVTYTQAAGAQTTINIPLNNNTTVHGLVPNYVGATASVAGKPGLVPSATTAQRAMFLKADGTWATPSTGTDTQVTHTGTTSPIYLLGTINTADGTSTVNKSTAVYVSGAGTQSSPSTVHADIFSGKSEDSKHADNSDKLGGQSSSYYAPASSIPSVPVTAVIGDSTWTTAATSGNAKTIKVSHVQQGNVTTGTYGGSAIVPIISVDKAGHITSVTTANVKDNNYYTTTAKTTVSGEALQVKFDRTDTTAAYMFTIPAATESVSGISSTVSTDRLRNGTKTLILNGNFTV